MTNKTNENTSNSLKLPTPENNLNILAAIISTKNRKMAKFKTLRVPEPTKSKTFSDKSEKVQQKTEIDQKYNKKPKNTNKNINNIKCMQNLKYKIKS